MGVLVASGWTWGSVCSGGQESQWHCGLCQQQVHSRTRAGTVPCAWTGEVTPWTLCPVFGPLITRQTLRCWSVSRKGKQSWGTRPVRSIWRSRRGSAWRRLNGDLITVYNSLTGGGDKWGSFPLVTRHRTRRNDLRLCQGRFRWDINKNFFSKKVVKHLKRLPRGVVESPSLVVFKRCVDVTLGDMVWWWPWHFWGQVGLRGLSNLKNSMDPQCTFSLQFFLEYFNLWAGHNWKGLLSVLQEF